mgnify:CR=1 FL=1|jgi:hypothetical protein
MTFEKHETKTCVILEIGFRITIQALNSYY